MDAVEEVKSRINIEDVISEYVQLKRAGRNYKGLSPFSSEKTPSFIVSPEKQIWHDFSSGRGGNVFSFVMEMEGLDFKGALELLARKSGVDLAQYNSGKSGELTKKKNRSYEILEMATKFYQVQFSQSKNALEYVFKKRKFDKKTALEFKIGYSPNTGNALSNYLKKQGVSDAELKMTGLANKSMGGNKDMFRGRLMIPLGDPTGRIVGFTARQLVDEPNSPKYINTPQTLVYDKSRNVYGLNLAKDSIRKAGFSVLVEGNLDVISSHQVGVKNVVATAGTALTEFQLKALQRFSGDVRIAFDQDRAGLQAAERSIPIASKIGLQLSVITIPEGKDPDELIKKDPKLWEKAISETQPAVDWLIGLYQKQLDLSTASGKSQFSNIVMKAISSLSDDVEKEHYMEKTAKIIGVSKDALFSKLNADTTRNIRKRTNVKIETAEDTELVKIQSHLLSLCLMVKDLRQFIRLIDSEMLVGDEAKLILDYIKLNPDFSGKPEELKDLRKVIDYVKMLSLQFETLYQSLDKNEQHYEAQRLQVRLIDIYVKNQKIFLAGELAEADEDKTNQLLEKVKSLDLLLKRSEEDTI
jgi:DNA primase